jgi:hypothetical protein
MRKDGRLSYQLRPIKITPYAMLPHAIPMRTKRENLLELAKKGIEQ